MCTFSLAKERPSWSVRHDELGRGQHVWGLRGIDDGPFKLLELMCPDDGEGIPGVDAYPVPDRAKELALVDGETVRARWRISGVRALVAVEGPSGDHWVPTDPELDVRLRRVRGTLTLTDRRVAVIVPRLGFASLGDIAPGELLSRFGLFRLMRCVCGAHIPLESVEAVAVDGRVVSVTLPVEIAGGHARFRLSATLRTRDPAEILEAIAPAQELRPLGSPDTQHMLDGVLLSEAANAALELAATRRDGRPLDTFGILSALIATDVTGAWDTVQLRSTFVAPETAPEFRDLGENPAGHWRRVPLTGSARSALAYAAATANDYRLLPLPPGVIALGLVADAECGACRALLDEADIGREELFALLQDELLDTRLERLRPPSPTPIEPVPPEAPAMAAPRGPFTATAATPPVRPAASSPGSRLPALPAEMARRLEAGDHLHRRRTATTDPWVIASGDRVYKVYDLESLDDAEQQLIRSRASVGLSFRDIEGVVPTLAVTDEGSTLIVEMPRMGPSLQEHLDRTAAGTELRLSPELYAEALARVASTLQRLHKRGLAHGAIKPANLLVDPQSGWLSIADVASAAGARAESARRTLGRASIDRYVAPEQHEGELGPSVDQYALGRTAQDVFTGRGAPPLTTPVHDALRKAMAPRPGDRCASVEEFGAALEHAVRAEAPGGLADRLERMRPTRRAALEPALAAFLASLVLGTAETRQGITVSAVALIEVLLAVALVTWFTWGTVAIAGKLGSARPLRSLDLLNRPWLALLVAVAIGSWLLVAGDDPNWVIIVWGTLSGVYGVRALLAAPPAHAGRGLVRVLRLWDRRRLIGTVPRWALSTVFAIAAAGVLLAPVIINSVAPRDWPKSPVSDFGPLAAVWNFRDGLGREDSAYVCNDVVAIPQGPRRAPCERLISAAAAVQSTDPVLRASAPAVGEEGTWESFLAQEIPAVEGQRFWRLLAPGKPSVQVGAMYTVPPGSVHFVVMIGRRAWVAGGSSAQSLWRYDVELRGDVWKVVGFRACDVGSAGTGFARPKCIISEVAPVDIVERINEAADARR